SPPRREDGGAGLDRAGLVDGEHGLLLARPAAEPELRARAARRADPRAGAGGGRRARRRHVPQGRRPAGRVRARRPQGRRPERGAHARDGQSRVLQRTLDGVHRGYGPLTTWALEGIRLLDFTAAVAGPWGTRYLAAFGA